MGHYAGEMDGSPGPNHVKAKAWDSLAQKNAEITRLRSDLERARKALEEAKRFMEYFAGETGNMFVGPGTPQTCLVEIRATLTEIAH